MSPTLIELLEYAAYNSENRETASQLRAAAVRLREEMEFAAQKRSDFARANNAVSTRAWELTEAALRSVNNGPLASPTPPVEPPLMCFAKMENGERCERQDGHNGRHSEEPDTPAAHPLPRSEAVTRLSEWAKRVAAMLDVRSEMERGAAAAVLERETRAFVLGLPDGMYENRKWLDTSPPPPNTGDCDHCAGKPWYGPGDDPCPKCGGTGRTP